MQITKKQIINVLEENNRLFNVDGFPLNCIRSNDYDLVAEKILTLLQSNDAGQPTLQQHNVNSRFVFDPALLDKIKGNAPTYSIGVDTYDEKSLAYCFCKHLEGKIEVLLAKTMRSKKDFKEEVSNLSKYFNAKICGEVD